MVAHVLVAKYADHAPLYRQAQMLARQGIVIDRSTLASWVGYAAAELKPLWRLLRDQLLGSAKLFVDETTAPVLDPGRGRTTSNESMRSVLVHDSRPPFCILKNRRFRDLPPFQPGQAMAGPG
jgi:transposase